MTSPTKRSALKSAVANSKGINKGTTRPPPYVDVLTRQLLFPSPFSPHTDHSPQS